eukprot:XP_019930369.1 PREDICTED: fibrinogen-like protein A isoform X1 [Crassostrea gigas]
MGRHYNLFIWILLMKSTKEQVLFDDLDDRQQNSLYSAIYLIKNELQHSVEKMLLQKLEEIESNLKAKINTRIEIVTKNAVECHPILISGTDCDDILTRCPNTREKDGVYNIVDVSDKMKPVYCDMTTDNGGWTVIQRRVNGSVDFYRNWTEYKNGFGFADHEYWIGNDLLHTISSVQPQELRVDMERFNGEKLYAVYSNFSVGNETSKYKLEMNGYSGNAGDSLNYHNNMKFSTPDQDNDNSSVNCATTYRAAWWFNWCIHANPNGLYVHSEKADPSYVTWFNYNASWISMKTMQLMIRSRA